MGQDALAPAGTEVYQYTVYYTMTLRCIIAYGMEFALVSIAQSNLRRASLLLLSRCRPRPGPRPRPRCAVWAILILYQEPLLHA